MSKKALIIGLDTYQSEDIEDLSWAVSDAKAIKQLLTEHQDKIQNYQCRILPDQMEDGSSITRATLRKACTDFFSEKNEQSLFYFSGHATLTPFGGHLCT